MKVSELIEELKGCEDWDIEILDMVNLNYLRVEDIFKDYRDGIIKLIPKAND